jgi:hypothetical protein
MTSKKKSKEQRRAKKVLKLSRRARTEVELLLRRTRTGTLTPVDLKCGLKEVDAQLKKMLGMIRYFL